MNAFVSKAGQQRQHNRHLCSKGWRVLIRAALPIASLFLVAGSSCRRGFVGQLHTQQVLRHRDGPGDKVLGFYGLHRETALAASSEDGASPTKRSFKKFFQKREVPVEKKSSFLTKMTRKNWKTLLKKYEFLKVKLQAQPTRSAQIQELRSKVTDLKAKLDEKVDGMGVVINKISARCHWLSENVFVDQDPITASAVLRLCQLDSFSKAMEILDTMEAQHKKIDNPSRWLVAAVSKVETARREREIAAAVDKKTAKKLRMDKIREQTMNTTFEAKVTEVHRDGVWVSIGNVGYKNWRGKLMVPTEYIEKIRMGSRFNGLKADKVEPASRTMSLVADDWEGRLYDAIERVDWTDLEEGDQVKGYVVGRTISKKSGPLVEVDVGADHVAHMYASSLDAKRKAKGDLPQPLDLVVQAVDVDDMKIRVDFVDAEN